MRSLESIELRFTGLILIIILCSSNIWGQNKNIISFNYSLGGNIMLVNGFEKEKGFRNDGMYIIGIRYQRKISETVSFKTGLDYCRNNILVEAGYHPYLPEIGESSWDINILSLPLLVNYQFQNYFFVEGGPIADLQFNIWDSQPTDTQSGVGIGLGIGGIYNYKNIVFILNPFVNYHAIVQFEPYDGDRLVEMGVKFGIGYRF